MEYRRTAVIKLDTPEGADAPLRETVEQFKHCANTASEWCWHGRRQIPAESGCQPETRRVSGDDDGYHVTSKAKAEEHGAEAVQVRNTSKRCSTCGFTHEDNRSGEGFCCQKCGYENHADYNASKDIGLQYLRRRQNANDGGAPVDVRLNRGTLNVNGECSHC